MDIVIDTSGLLAVILGEPERDRILELTTGHSLIGPGCIPWEVGNAFSAVLKRKKIGLSEAQKGLRIFEAVPIRYMTPDFSEVLSLANRLQIYAYDACFLACSIRHGAPFLTLDRLLKQSAQKVGVDVLEV
jgi:predicted nucleic acid-binding protein